MVGEEYNIADMEGVQLIQEPGLGVCDHENVFIVTSAPNNKHLRDSGAVSDDNEDIINQLFHSEEWPE